MSVRECLRVLISLAAAVVVAACGGEPAATAPATPGPGQRVYADTFADPGSGWPVQKSATTILAYGTAAGHPVYSVRSIASGSVVQVQSPAQSLPHSLRITATISVSAPHGLPGDGDAGVGCGYDGSAYVFVLRPGGAYAIVKYRAGAAPLDLIAGPPSAAVAPSPHPNSVSLTCRATTSGVLVVASVGGHRLTSIGDRDTAPRTAQHVQVWLRGGADVVESDATFSDLAVAVA